MLLLLLRYRGATAGGLGGGCGGAQVAQPSVRLEVTVRHAAAATTAAAGRRWGVCW